MKPNGNVGQFNDSIFICGYVSYGDVSMPEKVTRNFLCVFVEDVMVMAEKTYILQGLTDIKTRITHTTVLFAGTPL